MTEETSRVETDRTCRVKGCQNPATTVFPTRVRFRSPEGADSRGFVQVNVTLVFCHGHAADAVRAIREGDLRMGRRTLNGAGLRRFQRFLAPEGGAS